MSLMTLSSPVSSQANHPIDLHSVSNQSHELAENLLRIWGHLQTPWRRNLLQQIAEVYQECSVYGWDGYSAKPVSSEAVKSIIRLVKQLPLLIQTPEIVPTPEGRLGLEWHIPEGSTLVIEPSEDAKLNYVAILSNGDKIRGTTVSNDTIPEIVMQMLFSYFKR